MPIEHIQDRWHFHQRMNKKVAHNLERLRAISGQSKSKQAILDAMHPWRTSISIRYNNSFSYLLLGASIILIAASTLYLYDHGILLILSWLIGIGMGCYAYFSLEKNEEISQVIQQLTMQTFQYQYDVRFSQFPSIGNRADMNPSFMLARIRQNFDCLKEGNSANEIPDFASAIWHIDGHDYPVLLFQYISASEITLTDKNGNQYSKRIENNYWGACVFHMPPLAFMVSTIKSTYPRYPITWSTSDIQFNQRFKIAGQQEFELARTLTPQRTLSLANQLDAMKGTLMFHDEMQAFCYYSTQNIFAPQKASKEITDVSMLRGYLRTLNAPNYERMRSNLTAIIRSFNDESLIQAEKRVE